MTSFLSVYIFIHTCLDLLILYYVVKNRTKASEYFHDIQDASEKDHGEVIRKIKKCQLLCKMGRTCFVGIGGGGNNIIKSISEIDNRHKFIHLNSDAQALQTKQISHYKLLLGLEKKAGLGCGGNDNCGRTLIDDRLKLTLSKLTTDEDRIYIITTLGGGVGSGATPEIIEYLLKIPKEIVVFVTMPFSFEGKRRLSIAAKALKNIQALTDNVIVLNNDDLTGKDISSTMGMKEAFEITPNKIYTKIAEGFV